jgi:hypothetical protein
MRIRFRNLIRTAGMAALSLTAACGGGGGGYLSSSMPSSNTMMPGAGGGSSSSNGSLISGFTGSAILGDTGWLGSIAAPEPPSFGASASPAQIAMPNGPVFGDLPRVATTFPALSSSLQLGPTGVSAVANQPATVTLTGTNTHTYYIGETDTVMQLSIPSVNVNFTWTTPDLNGWYDDYGTFGLSYTVLGNWEAHDQPPPDVAHPPSGPLQSVTWFVLGYETPAAAMPTSGLASFAAWAKGTVFTPIDGHIAKFDVYGPGTLLADFATGKITGGLRKMTAYGLSADHFAGGDGPWNDVSISASIAAGANKFSGTTGVTSAPQNIFSLTSPATGSIEGAFYGPAAQNIGAIWTLSDGKSSAIGGLIGK